MSNSKFPFSPSLGADPFEEGPLERPTALDYIADAWNTAEADGLAPDALAHAALFAALASLVHLHGDDLTADLVAELPARIRAGDYTLDRVLH